MADSSKDRALPYSDDDSYSDPGEVRAPVISFRTIVWPLLLSLLVLAIIGYFTFEPRTFRELLQDLNPWVLSLAGGTVVLRILIGGLRLSYVSRGRLGLLAGIRGQLAWDFFSNVTPSTIGGGPLAAGYVAQDKRIPLGEATAILLFAMLLDQVWFALSVPLLLAAGVFFEIIPRSLGMVGTWTFTLYFVGLMGWVVFFGYATLFRPELLERGVDLVFRFKWLRRFRDRALGEMHQLRRRARVLRLQPAAFYVKGFLLTLAGWLVRYSLIVFILWSVYPEVDKFLTLLRSVALSLGAVILPTPGGAGGLEGLYALFMGPPLIPQALVVPTLLVWRILGYYIFIALGAFLSVHQVQKTIQRKKLAHRNPGSEDARNGTTSSRVSSVNKPS